MRGAVQPESAVRGYMQLLCALAQTRSRLGAQDIDGGKPAIALKMPKCPAVAGGKALHQRASLVNRSSDGADGQRSFRPHDRGVALLLVGENFARCNQSRLDNRGEGN